MDEDKTVNYPGNSNKERETPIKTTKKEPKKVEKLVTGDAVQRKRPLGRRIADTFTGEDMQSVGQYILFEVLIPAAKTMISDAASQGVERMLFGDSRPRSSSGSRPSGSSFTSYNKMHSSSTSRTMTPKARANHDFGEIIIPDRGEAEHILDQLQALIDDYEVATVSDLYQMVGITGTFTDDKWGWTNLHGAGCRRVRDGYLLELPRTSALD